MRPRLTVLPAILVLLWGSEAARAGTLEYVSPNRYTDATIVFEGGPGERNDVRVEATDVSPVPERGGALLLVIRDAASPLREIGFGNCEARDAHTLACRSYANPFEARLGDGDDSLTLDYDGGVPYPDLDGLGEAGDDRLVNLGSRGVELFGGAGDDRLLGGTGDDALQGGPGSDELDGGTGRDTARYDEGGGGAVDVDLARRVARRGPEERDGIERVEDVLGSPRADVLRGGDGPNRLDGALGSRGRGGDRLIGRGGDDSLRGVDGGRVYFDGGLGDDELVPVGRGNRLGCGPGEDDLTFTVRNPLLPLDCERIELTYSASFGRGRVEGDLFVLDVTYFPSFAPPCPYALAIGEPGGRAYTITPVVRTGRLRLRLGARGRERARRHQIMQVRLGATGPRCRIQAGWRIRP